MKLSLFQQYLQEQAIDWAFLFKDDINLTYFTQVKPSESALLSINPEKAVLYTTILDQRLTPQKGIALQRLEKGWEKQFQDKLGKKSKTIGINKEALTLAAFDRLKKRFPSAKFIDVSEKLKELRQQKTPEEIKKIATACKITDQIFNKIINFLHHHHNLTEQQLYYFIESKIREHRCEIAFPPIVANANNATLLSHQTSNNPLKRGFLILDFGVCYQNYCSDMTRTIFLGQPNKEEKELYQIVLGTQTSTISELNEINKNHTFPELDKFCRQRLGKYSSYLIHSLGHGIGLEPHEAPSFFGEPAVKVLPQMTFTIEPGIYYPHKFGLRIEDMVLFEGKARVLTKSPKELITISI